MTRYRSGPHPTGITSYVVSGVGFLGAGVIISVDVIVRGIDTAATLWCTAAVGALAASGFVWQAGVAIAAILAILAINILSRPLGRRIDRQPVGEHCEIDTSYRFRAATRDKKEARVRAPLQSISGHRYQLRALESADIDGADPRRGESRARDDRPQRRADRGGRRKAGGRTQRHVSPLARDRTRRPGSVRFGQHERRLTT